MANKEYSTFPKEPHYQMHFSIITRTFMGGGLLLYRGALD